MSSNDEILQQLKKLRLGKKMFLYMTVLMLVCLGSCVCSGVVLYFASKLNSVGTTMTSTIDQMNEMKPSMAATIF
jgi:hypothetical protein